jgi:Flp pilus assembly pilin Flp
MKMINKSLKSLWNDESAQGATEYILLLVVVVTLAFIFKDKIKAAVTGRLENISGEMGGFNVERQ